MFHMQRQQNGKHLKWRGALVIAELECTFYVHVEGRIDVWQKGLLMGIVVGVTH